MAPSFLYKGSVLSLNNVASIVSVLENANLIVNQGNLDLKQDVRQLCTDSRKLRSTDVFIAYQGVSFDSHDLIPDLSSKELSVLVGDNAEKLAGYNRPYILVSDSRKAWAYLAAAAEENPEAEIPMFAVTGTNGKTSSAWLAKEFMDQAGQHGLIIGTMGAFFKDQVFETKHTTPDPPELFALIRNAKELGADFVMMEVSSHSISQEKLGPIKFDGALFTSFSRDHLDFHKSMHEYFRCKMRLFLEFTKVDGRMIFHQDVLKVLQDSGINLSSYEIYGHGEHCQWQEKTLSRNLRRFSFELTHQESKWTFDVPLVGDFIISNLSGVLALFSEMWKGQDIEGHCTKLKTVPGRLERVESGEEQATVFVDYAHTPDALESCLKTLAPMVEGDLIVVFGCGGDRDRGKRPIMGKVAVQNADRVLITSDNPRSEDPLQIIRDIEEGVDKHLLNDCYSEVSRELAIKKSIFDANKNDCILLAGKGHETYQVLKDKTIYFDDRECAQKYIIQIERPK